jgi:hypothetical protein
VLLQTRGAEWILRAGACASSDPMGRLVAQLAHSPPPRAPKKGAGAPRRARCRESDSAAGARALQARARRRGGRSNTRVVRSALRGAASFRACSGTAAVLRGRPRTTRPSRLSTRLMVAGARIVIIVRPLTRWWRAPDWFFAIASSTCALLTISNLWAQPL